MKYWQTIVLWMAFCKDPFAPVESTTVEMETTVPKILEMTRHM